MSTNAPAGWYPQQDGTERWWDGQAWTAHSRPVPPPPTTPYPAAGQGTGQYAGLYASQYAGQYPGQYGAEPGSPGHASSPYSSWTATPGAAYGVAPKNPAVSLLASFFIPGLGTMLNGEVNKGVGILVGYILCLFTFFLIVPLLVAVVLWVWGMVDAYQGAQAWNRRHGILS